MTDNEDRSIIRLLPSDTPEYMLPAWLGCISFALKQPEMIAAFRKDTGNLWKPGTGLDKMIDEATGADWHFIKAFVLWANVNVWGPLDSEDEDFE